MLELPCLEQARAWHDDRDYAPDTPRGSPVVQGEDFSSAVCIGERGRDGHLAAHRGIRRLELDHSGMRR
jgi:hypothetical protein